MVPAEENLFIKNQVGAWQFTFYPTDRVVDEKICNEEQNDKEAIIV